MIFHQNPCFFFVSESPPIPHPIMRSEAPLFQVLSNRRLRPSGVDAVVIQNDDFWLDMGVSKNRGIPKSSILIGFSIINHPFWGTPNFWKHPYIG